MKKKESIFDKGKRTLPVTFGVVTILFFVMLYLSSWAPHFQGLGYLIALIGGFCAFNMFIPLLVYFCLRLILNSKRNVGFKRRVTGFIIISFAVGFLLLDIGFNGEESIANPGLFIEELNSAFNNNVGGYGFDIKLGAGFISYLLAGLINAILGGNFIKVISSVFILIGFAIMFAPVFAKATKETKQWMASRKIIKAKKEREREEQEGIDLSNISTSLLNEQLRTPPKLVSANDENVTSSRYERNMSNRLNNNPHIPERRFNVSNNSTGLVPALFGVDEESQTTDVSNSNNQPSMPEVRMPIPTPEVKPEIQSEPVSTIQDEISENTEQEEIAVPEVQEEIQTEYNLEPVAEPEPEPIELPQAIEEEQYFNQQEEPIEEPVDEEKEIFSGDPSFVDPEPKKEDIHEEERMDVVFHYDYPSSDLLNPIQAPENLDELEKSCLDNEAKINAKLESLGVGAYVVSHTIGPSVTRYEIKTNEDVPVSSVSRVINDLSIKLGGVPIRFETLVRGSETSGLEVVNSITSTVYFKECFEAIPTLNEPNLMFPFGKSVAGKVLFSDLSEFPHMLVSGTTGSGKSVFLHQILLSLVMRNSPNQLKMLLIDPKLIELGKYRELPQLICPVVSEPFRAKIALEKIRDEMERRYAILNDAGGMDIKEYNTDYAESHGKPKLPFIVVVIDEFGDLVDSCKNVPELVLKIAAKARAAGIHLIIATQRPDVSVISGTIKANLHTRVALSMSSPADSMTIIGQGGAEELNGRGDMLIDCQRLQRVGLVRCQGALVDRDEIRHVCDFIRQNSKPQYWKEFLDLNDHSNDAPNSMPNMPSPADLKEASDEKTYELVKEFIMSRDYASASGIQREFGFGYPRSAKFIDKLTKEGIIAGEDDPRNVSRGRFVIIHIQEKQSEPVGSLGGSAVIPEGYPQPGDD